MALTIRQRKALFISFLVLALTSAALEVFLVIQMVLTRQYGEMQTVVAAVNGGGLVMVFKLYLDLMRQEYLGRGSDALDERFARYFEWRAGAIGSWTCDGTLHTMQLLSGTMASVDMHLFESRLKDLYGDYRYELSVFANRDAPEIVSYFDSGGSVMPRSHNERQRDSNYYRAHHYEAVELLDNPSTDIIVIPDTRHTNAYSFVSAEQRERVRSTALFCFTPEQPRVLVVVCSERGVFKEDDTRLKQLILTFGMAARTAFELGGKLRPAPSD